MKKNYMSKSAAESAAKEATNDLKEIRKVLRKYFEGYKEYDPLFSAQDAIDEISAIVGM